MDHLDPVEHWKGIARARLESERNRSCPRATVRLTLGFMALCVASGALLGPWGLLVATVGISSGVLVQELPRVALTRGWGASRSVLISALGPEEKSSGTLHGVRAWIADCSGSVANLSIAWALLGLSHTSSVAPAAAFLQAIAWTHAIWGAGQALPLAPFRAGRGIAARLPTQQRLVHETVSAILAFVATGVVDFTRAHLLIPITTWIALTAAARVGRLLPEHTDTRTGRFRVDERANELLRAGRPHEAGTLAERTLCVARSLRARRMLWTTLTWAAIEEREPLLAHRALCHLPDEAIDFHLLASYLSCCNRLDEAARLLQEARESGYHDAETTRLSIDVSFRNGDQHGALALAVANRSSLSATDWDAIEAAIPHAKRAVRNS